MSNEQIKKMTGEMAHLLKVLRRYPGRGKAISMACLYEEWSGETLARNDEGRITDNVPSLSRHMRTLISRLRDEYAIPIMSSVAYGYWIVTDEKELREVCSEFHHRGLTSLRTAARLSKISLVEAVQQLALELQDENSAIHQRAQASKTISSQSDLVLGPESKLAIITQHLQELISQPDKYADQLHALQREFGPRLLPKSVQDEINRQANQVRELASQTIQAANKLQGMVQ